MKLDTVVHVCYLLAIFKPNGQTLLFGTFANVEPFGFVATQGVEVNAGSFVDLVAADEFIALVKEEGKRWCMSFETVLD